MSYQPPPIRLAGHSASVSIPRVATERLLLRELRVEDMDLFAAHFANPTTGQFIGGVLDRRSAWRALAGSLGGWMLQGMGWWAIEIPGECAFVGTVGVFLREGMPPDPELGWTLVQTFRGRGIATEAAAGALRFAIDEKHAKRVVAHIDAANLDSIRVAERLGMVAEGSVPFYNDHSPRFAWTRA